jgi:hypothetical protein
MQNRPDDVGASVGQAPEETGIGIEDAHAVPKTGQGIGHSATRAQGNIALMRDSARKNYDVQLLRFGHDQRFPYFRGRTA